MLLPRGMFTKLAVLLLMFSPEQFCKNFLLDAEYLATELGRIRQLALAVPISQDTYGPVNSVVDAVWNLEERIRYLRGLEESKKSGRTITSRKKRRTPQPDLFDTEELSGLRSAELSRELREIGKSAEPAVATSAERQSGGTLTHRERRQTRQRGAVIQ